MTRLVATQSEMRAGVRAGHPSVMVLKHGPADPSDLEASVKQYRVLLKTVEQVMFFFPAYVFFLKYAGPKYASQKTVEHSTLMQLVAVMKQDQEKQKV